MLITAVKYNTCDAAKFLLSIKAGVKPDFQDKDGFTALHYAVESANLQLINVLVSKGARVDCQNHWNQTPLHCAVQRENTPLLQEILLAYPSLTIEDIYGMNSIHAAALLGNLQCLKLLNPDKAHFFFPTSNTRQDLPNHLAAYGGHTDVVKWIAECGVRIDGRNRKGITALDIAIERGNKEIINLLQDIGANTNADEQRKI